MYKRTILGNGLRIITVPSDTSKTVTVLALIGTGSKYEKKEVSGISHFLEHLLFKGTRKFPTEMDVFGVMDEIGGSFNAFTGPDYTGYYAKVQTEKFEVAMDWVSDMYLNATLPEAEIEKERGTIIEELNMYYDHPMRYIGTLWNELLYGDQPAGWDIGGTKETVLKISREELVAYRQSQYVASNTIVCISGNFNGQNAEDLAGKYFGPISSSKPFSKPLVWEKQEKPEILVYKKDTKQTQVGIGVRSYNCSYPKRYALEILSIILGGMSTSRLMEEVRIKRGLAYSVQADNLVDPDVGSLMATANLDSSRLEEGIKVILQEFKKISVQEVSASELKKAKDNYIGRSAIALESSHAQASFYAEQDLMENMILTPEDIFAKINEVTAGEILNVAQEIFRPERLNLALIGPYDKKEKFQDILKL
jgi:predicted Zn-dependent peptidase